MNFNLEKYDKLIWRVNGALLLFACVGAILVCTIVGYKLLNEIFRTRQVHDIVNVDQGTKKEEYLRLGSIQSLKGTDLNLIPLMSEQKYDNSYYSKSSLSRARNYLVLNARSKDSFWIWKTNSSLILDNTNIHNQITQENTQKTKGIVFEVVEIDSNRDGVLDEQDQRSIQYFDLGLRKSVSIVDQADRSVGVRQTGDHEVLFIYSRSGKSYSRSMAVPTLSLSLEKEIVLPR